MTVRERFRIAGSKLAHTIQQLASRGDVRRVCIIEEESSLLEIPMTLGDPAAPANILKAPILAAIHAYGTLVSECTIEVEKEEKTG